MDAGNGDKVRNFMRNSTSFSRPNRTGGGDDDISNLNFKSIKKTEDFFHSTIFIGLYLVTL